MRQIIRSLYHANQLEKDLISSNFQHIKRDVFQDLNKQEEELLDWLIEFFIQHRESPAYDTLHRYSLSNFQTETTVFLEETKIESPWYDSDFIFNIQVEYEKQKRFFVNNKLQEASDLLRNKVSADEVLSFLHTQIKLVDDDKDKPAHIEDTVDEMAEEIILRHKRWKEGEDLINTGYACLDETIGGLKKGQLVLLAGFVNHMKSTLMLNMIVNMVVESKQNVILFSSEMPRKDIMLMLGSIHSGNPIFVRDQGLEVVPANAVLTGRLESDEYDRWKNSWEDLSTNPDYGRLTIYDSSSFRTWGDIKAMTTREHLQNKVDILWLDYLTRLPPDRTHNSQDEVQSRNEMIVDAKRFALSFFGGEGLLVMTPFQVNRKGYINAKANQGKMDATALSQYNSAEKEADVIFTIFYDEDEAKLEKPKLGHIKSRYSQKSYNTFEVYVDSKCRRIFDPEYGADGVTQIMPDGSPMLAEEGGENLDLGFDPHPVTKPTDKGIAPISDLTEDPVIE